MSTSRRIRRASRRTKAFRKNGKNGSWSQELPRPMRHLAAMTAKYPGVWSLYDAARTELSDLWPEWVYCWTAVAYRVVAPGSGDYLPLEAHREAERVAALAAWGATKGIYRIDPTVLDHLLAAPVDRIPSESLLRLPEWGIYVEFPNHGMKGFFAFLDGLVETPTNLHIVVDCDHGPEERLVPLMIRLTDDLGEAVREGFAFNSAHAHAPRQFVEQLRDAGASQVPSAEEFYQQLVTPLLSVLLYLCSEEPEIEKERGPASVGTPRLEPRSRPERALELPTVWKTGFKLGKELRKVEASPHQGGTVRPHMRRAHWHSYRVGKGRNRVELRWIVPTPVGFKGVPEFATVRETE